ncbi:hypothetical protein K443DRAFT_193728 [Laccaria amethystina LaAM-08-1]|uniref:Uncharacterized protein n=1 Tax=Laccaria amethystina LaAM-08-1 TaxID=1095629 RepID=A0A0C9WN66_9AGAR|nr:hypothetical protein K443DRAFT_193728 [Laccaria amethystina LaAM-08-1]
MSLAVTLVFVFVGITETFCWIAHGSFSLYKDPQNDILLFLIALVWLYTVIRPIARPTATPTYDLFTIYLLLFGSSILQIGSLLYDHTVFSIPYPPPLTIFALSSNLVAVIGMLCLAIPGNHVRSPICQPRRLHFPLGGYYAE